MNILFTGGSSFTGYWFIKELAQAGHRVTAVFRRSQEDYEDVRRKRINALKNYCQAVFNCSFGSDKFLQIIESSPTWDLFCHHAADVTDYKSPQFNISQAIASNTHNLSTVLERLLSKQCQRVIITGSVFEQNEGIGSDGLRAFSPYGLSKGFTAEIFKYHAAIMQFSLGKFVIPNPFGPYEDPRFTSYLVKSWMQNKKASVNTPAYVRDNIHVSLLAKAYVDFATQPQKELFQKCAPSGYCESQGKFTERFALAMRPRLLLPCEFELCEQKSFPEPLERINTFTPSYDALHWNESLAWDALAHYYKEVYG